MKPEVNISICTFCYSFLRSVPFFPMTLLEVVCVFWNGDLTSILIWVTDYCIFRLLLNPTSF